MYICTQVSVNTNIQEKKLLKLQGPLKKTKIISRRNPNSVLTSWQWRCSHSGRQRCLPLQQRVFGDTVLMTKSQGWKSGVMVFLGSNLRVTYHVMRRYQFSEYGVGISEYDVASAILNTFLIEQTPIQTGSDHRNESSLGMILLSIGSTDWGHTGWGVAWVGSCYPPTPQVSWLRGLLSFTESCDFWGKLFAFPGGSLLDQRENLTNTMV